MRTLLFAASLLLSTHLLAQNPIPFLKKNGQYLYVDSVSRQPVGSDVYDEARPFSNGYAAVKANGKWGIVDRKGKQVVPLGYDGTYGMHPSGAAVVWQNKKYGLVNAQGKVIIPPEFEDLYLAPPLVVVKVKGSYGLYNLKGKPVLPAEYDFVQVFREGAIGVQKNGLYGYADSTGRLLVAHAYRQAKAFSEGKAAVLIDDQWGFIDKTGTPVIVPQYEQVNSFRNGLAAVRQNEKWGFIDHSGKLVVECKYDKVYDFEHEVTNVSTIGGYMWHLIDKRGNVVKNLTGVARMRAFKEGLAYGETLAEKVFVNTSGAIVIQKDINRWKYVSDFVNQRAVMTAKSGLGILIDKNGKELGMPFTDVAEASDGLYTLRLGEKTCYMNKEGKLYME